MPLFNSNLQISQGALFRKSFIWKAGGKVVNLTGWTARSQIRSTFLSSTILCDMTTENGLIEIEGLKGKVTLNIPASTTETFTFNISGAVYDVELCNPNNANEIISFVGGLVKLSLQVTR